MTWRRLFLRAAVIGVAALIALGACGTETRDDAASKPDATPERAGSPLTRDDYEGLWKLVEGTGPGGDIPADDWDITGHIKGKRIFGTTGCNDFGGRIKVTGTSIAVLRLGATEEGCGEPEAEGPYVAAMFAATGIARDADQLILTGPDTRLVFQAVPPPPVNKIVGRRWFLTKVLDARFSDAFRSVRPEGEASFLMNRDGAWEAATPCRRLEGRWLVEGDRIRSTESSARGGSRRCSEAASEQEGLIGSAFSEGFASVLQGKKLTIASDWGHTDLCFAGVRAPGVCSELRPEGSGSARGVKTRTEPSVNPTPARKNSLPRLTSFADIPSAVLRLGPRSRRSATPNQGTQATGLTKTIQRMRA